MAEKTASDTFNKGVMSEGLPQLEVSADALDDFSVLDAFVQLGLADSKGAVRRLIKGGGAKINNHPISDEAIILTKEDFDIDKKLQLSAGKKRHAILTLI